LNVEQIFQSLQKGKISPSRAEKLLSLYSIEKIGNIAQIDTGRKNRKGIPEIIFAEGKQLLDLKKIIKKIFFIFFVLYQFCKFGCYSTIHNRI